MNVYAKFRCAVLRTKKALRIFRELITTRTTTRVAFWHFWDLPSGSKEQTCIILCEFFRNLIIFMRLLTQKKQSSNKSLCQKVLIKTYIIRTLIIFAAQSSVQPDMSQATCSRLTLRPVDTQAVYGDGDSSGAER